MCREGNPLMDIEAPAYLWWKGFKVHPVFPRWGTAPGLFMRNAVEAGRESPDPSTRLGALLRLPRLSGAQVTSCNVPVTPAAGGRIAEDREYKMAVTEHAETGVILSALTSFGAEALGGELYCPWACCTDCARVIVAACPTMVVVHAYAMIHTPDDWRRSIELGHMVLAEANIPVYQTIEPLGLTMLLRGKEIPV